MLQAADQNARHAAQGGLASAPSAPATRRLSVCLICPRFEPSFFGLEYALPLLPGDKRAASFPGALPLLAALVSEPHAVTLVDENVEPLDFDQLRTFDVVGITGMIVQKRRMDEILRQLAGAGPVLCVGGPYVSVDEGYFAGKCDVIFVGEADRSWPQFIDDFAAGKPTQPRYEQPTATDLATLPPPRYDLLKSGRYYRATTQFGRGCPYLCEFCDIITIFGRKPRHKRTEQILTELDALLRLDMRSVFFVDDNFIANKKEAKRLLRALVDWQSRNGYAMTFSTEASVDLGDQPEILELLWQANFDSVFIGIESPRAESLLETRKVQNVRGDSVEAKLARIRDSGLVIQAGFIVGFDHDDESIFEEQFRFVQRTGIGAPFISVLSPIPSTPLYARLQREGRLRSDDEMVWFEPKLMSRQRLKLGCHELNARSYQCDAFFERIFERQLRSSGHVMRRRQAQLRRRQKPAGRVQAILGAIAAARRLAIELRRHRKLGSLGVAYISAWWRQNRPLGRNGLRLTEFVALCVRHWHCVRIIAAAPSNWGH